MTFSNVERRASLDAGVGETTIVTVRFWIAGLALALVALAACSGSPAGSPVALGATDATARCIDINTPGVWPIPPAGATLRAAFSATPTGLDLWHTRLIESTGVSPGIPNPDATAPAASTGFAYVCYFDGDFGRPRGNPPSSVPDLSRIVVVIEPDGTQDVVAMGFADRLPVIDPNP